MSAEGGGAITEGAGSVNLEWDAVSRSGAETGGGTTLVSDICTGEREISRLTAPGAGGTTVALKAGVERDLSREILGAGAMTAELNSGANSMRSCETLGAGGITAVFNVGAVICWSRRILGAGATTDSRETPPRV